MSVRFNEKSSLIIDFVSDTKTQIKKANEIPCPVHEMHTGLEAQ